MLDATSAASLENDRSNPVLNSTASEAARKFGFTHGQVIQEFYYDDDVDMALRSAIEEITGEDLADEDFAETTDAALIWWRAEDAEEDDLTDLLVDAATNLDDGGDVWLFTPKGGRPGHVATADIEDAATTAGMHASATVDASKDWIAMRLVARPRGV